MNFERHKDRVALVTGGSRGIGRATSLQLAREGAMVFVNYHQRREAAQEVVSEIEAHGGSALALQADVSDRQAVQAMVDQIVQKISTIDILVNNAGILLQGQSARLPGRRIGSDVGNQCQRGDPLQCRGGALND